jgi:carbon-monoxide dehydrogenase large subunit
MGGGALCLAIDRVIEKARRIAAYLVEAAPEDMMQTDGGFAVKGVPDNKVTWRRIAAAAHGRLPRGLEPGLQETVFFDPKREAWSFGAHVVMVRIDRETGEPKIEKLVLVDDCGTVINPPIVEGQVYGATAHGIGAALMENCVYDAVGNMLTSTFSDYIPITAVNMPKVKYGHIETPSPHSYSGAKGMGEGGAAPIHTISAALQDALFAQGIFIEDSFNNADRLFRALVAKETGQADKLVKLLRR